MLHLYKSPGFPYPTGLVLSSCPALTSLAIHANTLRIPYRPVDVPYRPVDVPYPPRWPNPPACPPTISSDPPRQAKQVRANRLLVIPEGRNLVLNIYYPVIPSLSCCCPPGKGPVWPALQVNDASAPSRPIPLFVRPLRDSLLTTLPTTSCRTQKTPSDNSAKTTRNSSCHLAIA